MVYTSTEAKRLSHLVKDDNGSTVTKYLVIEKNDGTFEAVAVGGASSLALTPISTSSTSDFVLANTSTSWADLDTASSSPGTAAARPMDLIFPNMTAGKWIVVELSGLWSNGAAPASIRAVTIVGGNVVNSLAAADDNMATWYGLAGQYDKANGSVAYLVQAGDIESGAVRVRLQYNKNSASAKTLYGATAFYKTKFIGQGPF